MTPPDELTRRAIEEVAKKLEKSPSCVQFAVARDLIISWSNKGDTVLDPFAGSGTVPIMAKRLERIPYAIDISEKYLTELVEPGLASISPLFSPAPPERKE